MIKLWSIGIVVLLVACGSVAKRYWGPGGKLIVLFVALGAFLALLSVGLLIRLRLQRELKGMTAEERRELEQQTDPDDANMLADTPTSAWRDFIWNILVIPLAILIVMGPALLYHLVRYRSFSLNDQMTWVHNAAPVAMFLLPPMTATSASTASFRAMLINVNTERGNPSSVVAAITNANPDIVVLEEISDTWVKALSSILEGYVVRKIETRDDNFGMGLLSRIPCVSTQVVYIGDAVVPSIFAELMLGDKKLTLIATHPLPPGGPNYSSYRNQQLNEVAQKITTIQQPVLLMGDLNVTPWSYYYRRFMKTSGLKDTARGRSIVPTWPTFCPLLWIQIDHCFYSDEIAIISRRGGKNVGSDHYPVIVDFGWKTSENKLSNKPSNRTR